MVYRLTLSYRGGAYAGWQRQDNALAIQQVVEEAHRRDIIVIADFWKMNMDTIIMEATGLDGWAHSSPWPS